MKGLARDHSFSGIRRQYLGDVHGPDLVRPLDRQAAQQIRINLVSWSTALTCSAGDTASRCTSAASLYAPCLTADDDTFAAQQVTQHSAACERVVQMQCASIRRMIASSSLRHRLRFVVKAAPADPEQGFACRASGKVMGPIDHRFALSSPALPSAPDKKSFSSVSSPILACSDFKSTAGAAFGRWHRPNQKDRHARFQPVAPFQVVIWFG